MLDSKHDIIILHVIWTIIVKEQFSDRLPERMSTQNYHF
jgi:hypothetical protein